MSALRTVRAALAGVACLLLIACGAPDVMPTEGAGNASPEAATPVEPMGTASAPVGTPDETFPDGFVLTIQDDVDTTVRPEVIARSYDLVVVGRVAEKLPAFWTTPDGGRPTVIADNVPYPYAIVTPYLIELEVPDYLRALTGPIIPLSENGLATSGGDSNQIVVVAVGGTIGKDAIVNHTNSGPLTVGEQVLVTFVASRTKESVAPSEQLVPTTAGPGWWSITHFVLDADGSAVIYDQTMSAVELVQNILNARTPRLTEPATP